MLTFSYKKFQSFVCNFMEILIVSSSVFIYYPKYQQKLLEYGFNIFNSSNAPIHDLKEQKIKESQILTI